MAPAIFSRKSRITDAASAPSSAVALPPHSAFVPSASSSPRLPSFDLLPPLVTNGFPPILAGPVDPAAARQGSPTSSRESTASFSHSSAAAWSATGRGTASTCPSSIEEGDDDVPPSLAIKPAVLPTSARDQMRREPASTADVPAQPKLAPPIPSVPRLPPSAQELVVQAQAEQASAEAAPACARAEGEVVEGCGCDEPQIGDDTEEGAEQRDEPTSEEEDADLDADEEGEELDEDELAAEAEDLIFQAQSHFISPFPTARFLAEQSRRPSLPLPALPIRRRPSAFAEEGLAPLPEDRVLEAREGGVVGGSSADEGTTTDADGIKRPRRKSNKLVKKHRPGGAGTATRQKKPRAAEFHRFKMPTQEDLDKASACEVVAEDGQTLKFGDLIKANGPRKTVVIFLRHAWCGLCAQYVEALNRVTVNLVSIETSAFCNLGNGTQRRSRIPALNILFINSGSPKLIATYRKRMKTPFPLYSNRERDLYKALGMNKKTWDMGKDSEKGSYIVKSQLGNVTSSISAGVAMRAYPGSQSQLGGEFVFEHSPDDGTVKCLFASRMHTTRAHAEIEDVFTAAGVELNADDAASVYNLCD